MQSCNAKALHNQARTEDSGQNNNKVHAKIKYRVSNENLIVKFEPVHWENSNIWKVFDSNTKCVSTMTCRSIIAISLPRQLSNMRTWTTVATFVSSMNDRASHIDALCYASRSQISNSGHMRFDFSLHRSTQWSNFSPHSKQAVRCHLWIFRIR